MAGTLGRLNPQYYQASGEATPQMELPAQFQSNPPADSPLSDHLGLVTESYHDHRRGPVVQRVPRQNGMRTLYSRGRDRMLIRRDGADGTPRPWVSGFQPDNIGPIRNCHFNDSLYEAGYPGYNLGLSFKVPTLQTLPAGTARTSVEAPSMITISRNPPLMRRRNR